MTHDIDSCDCPCGPDFLRACDDCEDGAGCWKCEKGLIRITREEADAADEPIVIVHQDV